ncbi:MAG: SGNH/GDSL hydrolase family protein [Muribaculaceae bacterium]|nr:SGNH/GDSL hydrolase family protein [Muribaculaceae bacterium]
MRNSIILLLALFSMSLTAKAQNFSSDVKMHKQSPDSVRILWIGNSFTFYNDVPKMVEDMARLNGVPVSTTRILKGGESFKGHLQNPELIKQLEKGMWDYVVMQEFSSTPAYSTKYVAENIMPYAAEIDSLAKKFSPEVETIYYMTWGHKNGNVRQTDYPLDDTYESMQDRISTTYIDMAYENGGLVAPVGIAWKNVRTQYPEIELYIEDNFHPSLAGSYLAALTLMATMVNGEFMPIFPEGMDNEVASILYKEAIKAVK